MSRVFFLLKFSERTNRTACLHTLRLALLLAALIDRLWNHSLILRRFSQANSSVFLLLFKAGTTLALQNRANLGIRAVLPWTRPFKFKKATLPLGCLLSSILRISSQNLLLKVVSHEGIPGQFCQNRLTHLPELNLAVQEVHHFLRGFLFGLEFSYFVNI